MSGGRLACSECETELPLDFANTGEFLVCPRCNALVRAFAFPALQRSETAALALPALASGEASCFYHPQKKAVVACDNCGRFLCGLCDVEISGHHRCPGCLKSASPQQNPVENRRVLYDGLALALAILPLLGWPVTIFTAPTAIFIVVRHWHSPLSILPRTRIRFVLAFVIALAEICGWVALIYFVIARAHR
ncbi:MAG: B-box zinc finger protein [Spartobacteria bacterium]